MKSGSALQSCCDSTNFLKGRRRPIELLLHAGPPPQCFGFSGCTLGASLSLLELIRQKFWKGQSSWLLTFVEISDILLCFKTKVTQMWHWVKTEVKFRAFSLPVILEKEWAKCHGEFFVQDLWPNPSDILFAGAAWYDNLEKQWMTWEIESCCSDFYRNSRNCRSY